MSFPKLQKRWGATIEAKVTQEYDSIVIPVAFSSTCSFPKISRAVRREGTTVRQIKAEPRREAGGARGGETRTKRGER